MSLAVEGTPPAMAPVAPAPPTVEATEVRATFSSFTELLKLRVTTMVVATAWAGWYLGSVRSAEPALTWYGLHAMLGVGLASGGAAALNQVIEKRQDALMHRTRRRPIPTGALSLTQGAVIGSALILGACLYLAYLVNPLTAILTFLTAASYVGLYTPLKTRSTWATFIGAIPGAMPPLLGWTAARGVFEGPALVLFAILFVWQFPHFQAIAWLYREDYARAGILMLPVAAPDGRAVAREVIIYSALLLPVSLVPTLLHMTGLTYFVTALVFGLVMLYYALQFTRIPLDPDAPVNKKIARQMLRISVLYLPIVYGVMMWNAVPPAKMW